MNDQVARGRKFIVVKWLIVLTFYLSTAIILLAVFDKTVPQSLGLALGVSVSGVLGYIGVNAWQKKIQAPSTPAGGGNA